MPVRAALVLAQALALAAVPASAAEPAAGDAAGARPGAEGAAAGPGAETFVLCVVMNAEGKRLSEKGRKYYGEFYTRSLRHALALAPEARVRELLAAAGEKHDRDLAAKDEEGRKAYVNGALDACEAAEKAMGEKLEPARPEPKLVKDSDYPPEKTDTIAILAALGKPDHEDYNPDGRFIYGYEVGNIFQMFLFSPDNQLLRIRHYCDKLKGACPE